MQVALDRQAEAAADGAEFREADIAQLGGAHAEVAETEGAVRVVGIERSGARCSRRRA